jgi:hypothetical protein
MHFVAKTVFMMSLRYSWLAFGLGGRQKLEIARELLEIGVSDRQNKFVVSFLQSWRVFGMGGKQSWRNCVDCWK